MVEVEQERESWKTKKKSPRKTRPNPSCVKMDLGDGRKLVGYSFCVDSKLLFTDYAMAFIRKTVETHLAKAFLENQSTEKFDKELRESLDVFANASYHEARKIGREIMEAGEDEFMEMIRRVVGEDEEGDKEE